MIELGMIAGTVFVIAKIADFDDRSEIVWGGIGLALIIACAAVTPTHIFACWPGSEQPSLRRPSNAGEVMQE